MMLGNFIGDAVKGAFDGQYPKPIGRGIAFHRFIDSFTDSHTEVSAAKKLLRPSQGKFSGVVVDVLFDHFLAIHWSRYHAQDLGAFAENCYAVVQANREMLPRRSEQFFRYMVQNNILEKYATIEGIQRVLRGMDSRTKYDSHMMDAVYELDQKFELLDGHFQRFFPELKERTEAWKAGN